MNHIITHSETLEFTFQMMKRADLKRSAQLDSTSATSFKFTCSTLLFILLVPPYNNRLKTNFIKYKPTNSLT